MLFSAPPPDFPDREPLATLNIRTHPQDLLRLLVAALSAGLRRQDHDPQRSRKMRSITQFNVFLILSWRRRASLAIVVSTPVTRLNILGAIRRLFFLGFCHTLQSEHDLLIGMCSIYSRSYNGGRTTNFATSQSAGHASQDIFNSCRNDRCFNRPGTSSNQFTHRRT